MRSVLFVAATLLFVAEAHADDARILPGTLDMPVIEGSRLAEECRAPAWESACVRFPANRQRDFVDAYTERLAALGWRTFELGPFLAKHAKPEDCRKLLAVSVVDQQRWARPDTAELGFVAMDCSGAPVSTESQK